MKYICNRCGNVFPADDMTMHYTTGNNGIEIVAICPSDLEKYLEKTKVTTEQKQDDIERKKMKMKW
jgi:predicted  nucleic acid-binding Zn-ribbon protein